ncbi:Mitochodrial transcription termination factor-related protein [Corchorus olitorius]|uniref:Mitochodrial transcription termination factor-related protein n=1 Tax=Corchorus olitorius TaxID=93759 RepID=A0A1R3FXE3_9ROSI|nr:Mitochodrial transcription termination factor-related protein [Corchorus olitorius]
MIRSFCKKQLYNRGISSRILPSFKYVNFLQNHGLISVAIRYLSVTATPENSFTISYLINSCGLSPKSAKLASKRVYFETPEKPDSLISFLKNQGFSGSEIAELIRRAPKILVCNPEKTLLPKFEFFYSRGVSSSSLAKILSACPSVLESNLNSCIIPNFNFFKDFAGCSDDKVLVAYKRSPWILVNDFRSVAAPNLAILRECRVPESNIMSYFVNQPAIFAISHERFKRTVEEVKKLGVCPVKQKFLLTLQALLQISESTKERKLNVYREWGWSDEEIALAFVKFPFCFMYSVHKIKAAMNFYINTAGLRSSDVANRPRLLGFSLEKRIIPRFAVIQFLSSKGLIKNNVSLAKVLGPNEKKFLQMFVIPYGDPDLLKLYKGKLGISK